MANNEWLDKMLDNKIEKEAMESQGTDKQDHFERKVQAHAWIKEVSDLDPVAIEAEYNEKLRQEAKMLGKTAALDDVIADGVTPEETVNRDYKRDVTSLSDYALAELLAEARGHKAQNTSEMYYELKEKAKAEVASSREKAEKALLEMIPDNAQLDWQKAFKAYTKDATPAEAKEKDLFKSDVPEKAHDFEHPSEEKFKLPKDPEKALPGNGREADERKEVTQEAGVLKKDIVEGTSKDASLKTADKVKDNPANKTEPLAMPEGKKSAGDKPEESVDGTTFPEDKKEVGDKDDQAMDGNSPEKGDKAKHEESVKKDAAIAPEPIADEAAMDKDAAQNQAVIDAFLNGQGGAKSMNLTIVKGEKGVVLVNYETPIAFRSADGQTYLNNQKYSQTTSVIQNKIRSAAQGQIKEVSPEELEKIMSDPAPASAEAPAAAQPIAEKTADGASASDNCPVCNQPGEDLGNGQPEHMSCKACGLTYASSKMSPKADLETDGVYSPEEIAETFINGNISDARKAIGNDIGLFVEVLDILGGSPEADSFKRLMAKHASKEIKNAATKSQVIKKVAEVQSPWVVTTDEQGNEVIARVDASATTTTKESEEHKEEEIQK